MSAAWPKRKLFEVSAAVSTGPFGSMLHKADYADEGVPLVNPINIVGDRIVPDPKKLISKSTRGRLSSYILAQGDVIVARRGEIGRCAVVGPQESGWVCGTGSFYIRPAAALDPQYLACLIRSNGCRDQLRRASTGTTMENLTNMALRELLIPFPPLEEQRRTVRALDKAFAAMARAKANTEKNLQNARSAFESRLESVFTPNGNGWKKKKLKTTTTKIGSGATPLGGERVYEAKGIPLIRSLNVHDTGFRHGRLAFLSEPQAAELDNVAVRPNDVLLNITGASIARCCVVPTALIPARVNQHVSILRPIPNELDSDFLHYLLISRPYKNRLLRTGEGGGSTRQAITKAQIEEFSIAAPERVDEQRAIASSLSKLESAVLRLADAYEQKLAALEELRKSLLQEAFEGRL